MKGKGLADWFRTLGADVRNEGGRSISLRPCTCYIMGWVKDRCLGGGACGQQCPLQGCQFFTREKCKCLYAVVSEQKRKKSCLCQQCRSIATAGMGIVLQ